jgi:hypothetical protein
MAETLDTHENGNCANRVLVAGLYYFGTALDIAGHYFWQVFSDKIKETDISFENIPFDPENLIAYKPDGTVKYLIFEDYKVCAIEGSCRDRRPGSHSIFWTKEPIKLGDFKEILLSIPITKQIIEQMPFEVAW